MQRYATIRSTRAGPKASNPEQLTPSALHLSAWATAIALATALAISANGNALNAAEAGNLASPYAAHTHTANTRMRLQAGVPSSQPGKLLSVTMAPLEIGTLQASAYGDDIQIKRK